MAGNDIILHVEWDVKLDFPNDADVISLAVAERPRVLRVIEHFTQSLEVIRNDTLDLGVCTV